MRFGSQVCAIYCHRSRADIQVVLRMRSAML